MTITELSLVCAAAGAVTAALIAVVLGRSSRNKSGEFATQAVSFAGSVLLSAFILITGFLIVGSWQLQATVRQHTQDEGRVLATAYSTSSELPPDEKAAVRAALTRYTHTVVDVEWPEMGRGHASAEAWRELDAVRAVLTAAPPPAKGTPEAQASDDMQTALDDVYTKRYALLGDLSASQPPILVAAMVVTGMFVLAYPPLVGLPSDGRHIALMAFGGAIIGFGMLLVFELSTPFTPPISPGPGAFRDALARFAQLP